MVLFVTSNVAQIGLARDVPGRCTVYHRGKGGVVHHNIICHRIHYIHTQGVGILGAAAVAVHASGRHGALYSSPVVRRSSEALDTTWVATACQLPGCGSADLLAGSRPAPHRRGFLSVWHDPGWPSRHHHFFSDLLPLRNPLASTRCILACWSSPWWALPWWRRPSEFVWSSAASIGKIPVPERLGRRLPMCWFCSST